MTGDQLPIGAVISYTYRGEPEFAKITGSVNGTPLVEILRNVEPGTMVHYGVFKRDVFHVRSIKEFRL